MKENTTLRTAITRRTTVLLLIAVLLTAFGLRFALFFQLTRSPLADMLAVDSEFYHNWAGDMAAGNWIGEEVLQALPVYPYSLGLVYAVFGHHLQVARFLQVLLGTLNCYLLFCLGRRLLGPRIALGSAFVMAAYQWIILYDCSILSPVLVTFVNLSMLLSLLRARDKRRGPLGFLLTGLLAGIAIATAAHVSVFVLLAAMWIVLSRSLGSSKRRTLLLAAFIVGASIPISTITLRNWHVGRDFVPMTTHGGINFYIGNNPSSRGLFDPPPTMRTQGAALHHDSIMHAEKALGRSLKPSEASSYWFGRGLEFMAQQPARAIRLTLRKFVLFWDRAEVADVTHPQLIAPYAPVLNLPMFSFGVIAPPALLGILLAWPRRKRLALLYLFVASWTFSAILFFINSRYRVPVVPFLSLFAVYTLWWWYDSLRRRRYIAVPVSLIALVLLILFVNPPTPRTTVNMGAGRNHLACFLAEKGDLRGALREYSEAAALEPDRSEAHYNLGTIHFRMANFEAAHDAFFNAVRLNPAYEVAFMNLGLTYQKMRRREEAFDIYLHVVRTFSGNLIAYRRLALLCHTADGPSPVFEELLDAAADGGEIHLQLGSIYSVLDVDRRKAIYHLEKAVARLSDSSTAHLYLGNNYYYFNDLESARAHWQAALALDPDDKALAEMLRATKD